jgi:hypothetical protein
MFSIPVVLPQILRLQKYANGDEVGRRTLKENAKDIGWKPVGMRETWVFGDPSKT